MAFEDYVHLGDLSPDAVAIKMDVNSFLFYATVFSLYFIV